MQISLWFNVMSKNVLLEPDPFCIVDWDCFPHGLGAWVLEFLSLSVLGWVSLLFSFQLWLNLCSYSEPGLFWPLPGASASLTKEDCFSSFLTSLGQNTNIWSFRSFHYFCLGYHFKNHKIKIHRAFSGLWEILL